MKDTYAAFRIGELKRRLIMKKWKTLKPLAAACLAMIAMTCFASIAQAATKSIEGAELFFSATPDGELSKEFTRYEPENFRIYTHVIKDGKELEYGKDYDLYMENRLSATSFHGSPCVVSHSSYIYCGENLKAVITGLGIYAGSESIDYFTAHPTKFDESNIVIEGVKDYIPYVKGQYDQRPKVYMEYINNVYDVVEKDEVQYTLSFEDVNDGTVNMIISGIPEKGFEGSVTVPFHVTKADINDGVKLSIYDRQNIGGQKTFPYRKQPIQLTTGDYWIRMASGVGTAYTVEDLVEGVDYITSYKNNVNPGTATMTVTGIGHFTGSRSIDFEIVQHDISNCRMEVSDLVYTGKPALPETKIYDEISGELLVEGVDYKTMEPWAFSVTPEGEDGRDMTVSGINGYKNSTGAKFMVLADPNLNVNINDKNRFEITYNKDVPYVPRSGGYPIKDLNLKIHDKVLNKDLVYYDDYYIDGFTHYNLGPGTVYFYGRGLYVGNMTLDINIVPRDISKENVFLTSVGQDHEYTGKPITPGGYARMVMNEVSPVDLPKDSYDVEYVNNVNPGIATIRIIGKGVLTGVKEQTFRIVKSGEPSDPAREKIEGFVTRLYRGFLNREPDAAGLKDWSDKLASKAITGCSAAKGFAHSQEFENLGLNDEQYVTRLYQTIFGRDPDAAGLASWVAVLDNGATKDKVLEGFLNSDEMAALCASAGIEPGTYKSKAIVDTNYGATSFVSRLYRLVLGRKADAAGLEGWVSSLASKKQTASQVVKSFFGSDEWNRKNTSNETFVKTAYQAILGREADASGLKTWTDALKSGKSRASVLNGFLGSAEFASLCGKYGITK